jgi:N4-gp56 family major capsid protein
MSQHTWNFDAPTGVYKNHQLSSDLRFASIAETKFMQFVRPEAGYGKKRGESITITRVSNIAEPTSGKISEAQRIPEDEVTLSTVAITVTEWGRAVPYTSLALDLGKFDIENIIQRKLRDQMALVMDGAAADAMKTGQIKYVPTGVQASTITTNGAAGAQATANMNLYHVQEIRDYLFSTLNAPTYEGDDYIGLISTKGKRGIMNDPAWESWHKYTDPQNKFRSEIGRMENIRFIEINNTNALSGALGSGSVLGEALIFGEDTCQMAVAMDPELRAEMPKDFGRSQKVAWYGILEFGMAWGDSANAGEARIVHVTST